MHQPRTYRNRIQTPGLVAFQVVVKETDLHIQADRELEAFSRQRVLYHRDILEKYIIRYPEFATTLTPWGGNEPKPAMVEDMVWAGRQAGVGPMAAVAGAIAANVGTDLLTRSKEVIVENGGDVYINTGSPVTIGIYAGKSPIESKLGLLAGGDHMPVGVCTSSGVIGHSLSYGKADAVCAVSPSCALADAVATAIGNRVQRKRDIRSAIDWGREIREVKGIVIIMGDQVGAWGEVELVPVEGKKG